MRWAAPQSGLSLPHWPSLQAARSQGRLGVPALPLPCLPPAAEPNPTGPCIWHLFASTVCAGAMQEDRDGKTSIISSPSTLWTLSPELMQGRGGASKGMPTSIPSSLQHCMRATCLAGAGFCCQHGLSHSPSHPPTPRIRINLQSIGYHKYNRQLRKAPSPQHQTV